MLFPTTTEYIDSVLLADSAFKSLRLEPVLDTKGSPVFITGNFAITFKMRHPKSKKMKALKCYTRTQPDQHWRLGKITNYFKRYPSEWITKAIFLKKELWVESQQIRDREFPVLLMDWSGDMTLGQYVTLLCRNRERVKLKQLAGNFDVFAGYLLQQEFAHGDLKHDNLVISKDPFSFKLIDIDGMFLPIMQGAVAPETGSPGYRHPGRDRSYYDQFIDDFSLLLISTSLHILSEVPGWYDQFCNGDNLLFTEKDLLDPDNSKLFQRIITEHKARAVRERLEKLLEALKKPPGPIHGLYQLLASDKRTFLPQHCLDRYDRIYPFHNGLAVVRNQIGEAYQYGFIDESGRASIPLQFSEAKHFQEGLAPVKTSKWGFIDRQGEFVIPAKYEAAEPFQNGFAQVMDSEKWGYIRPDGHLFLRCIYEDCKPFGNGAFEVLYRGKWAKFQMGGRR